MPSAEKPLFMQFQCQLGQLGKKQSWLIEKTGLSAGHVCGVLNGTRHPSDKAAHLIGRALGFDAPYIASMLGRDRLARVLEDLDDAEDPDPIQGEMLGLARARLDDEASWRNPFASSFSAKRLAFETLRVRHRISREEFARAHGERTGEDSRRVHVSLGKYEYSRKAEDPDELDSWLATLSRLAGMNLDRDELEALDETLLRVQALDLNPTDNRSFNWKDLAATGLMVARGRFVVPPNWSVRFGDIPTVHGQIDLELIEVRHHAGLDEPEPGAGRAYPGLTAYGDAGVEHAIVLKGEVWLRTSQPLDPRRKPNHDEQPTLAVYESVHRAPSLVIFDARLRHEVIFKGSENLILATNIRGEFDPSRKLGKKGQFNNAALRRGRRNSFDRGAK